MLVGWRPRWRAFLEDEYDVGGSERRLQHWEVLRTPLPYLLQDEPCARRLPLYYEGQHVEP